MDIAKGIAIICTIIGHTVILGSNIRNIIFSFHMPLFFIVAGYTTREIPMNEIKKNTIKDVKRLLLPVFICLIIDAILCILIEKVTINKSVWLSIQKLMWGNGNNYQLKLFGKIYNCYGIGVLWFLIALFWTKLLYRIILNKIKKNRIILCFSLSLIGIIIGEIIRLPQCIDIVLVSMIFMEYGNLLNNKYKTTNFITHNLSILLSFMFWIYFCFGKKIYIEIATRHYPLLIMSVAIAIMASWCIINFSKYIENFKISNIFIFLGKHSLELLCIHFFDNYYINLWNISNSLIIMCIMRCLINISILYVFEFGKKIIKENILLNKYQ